VTDVAFCHLEYDEMKILLVEDDVLLGNGVRTGLVQEGFSVDWVESGKQALASVASADYDLMVLDLGLPEIDGIDVLRSLRSQQNNMPVLILTARDTLADRVTGLDSGGDDFLAKPFDLDELFARIRALLRRQTGRASPVIEHGFIRLDPAGHQVTLQGTEVELSRKEFSLLLRLLENVGRVMSRSSLEESLYSWGEEVESNVIEVHIHHLRKKLGSDLIRTIRGAGYTIDRPKP
jgi:DNA-binding response OmpR family regulator